MTDLSTYVNQAKIHVPLALDGYDASPSLDLRDQLGFVFDNRQLRANPVRFDQVFDFPEVFRIGDQLELANAIDNVPITVSMDGYGVGTSFNESDLMPTPRDEIMVTLEQRATGWGRAIARHEIRTMMEVFRQRANAYTGQPFFTLANAPHSHPAGQGTFFNRADVTGPGVVPGLGDINDLTVDNARTVLYYMRAQMLTNQTLQTELMEAGDVENLYVIVDHQRTYQVFEQLRTRDRISVGGASETNELRGTFRLAYDPKGSATEATIRAVDLNATFKPLLFVIDSDLWEDAWEGKGVGSGKITIGVKKSWGVKPAFPQSAFEMFASLGGGG